MTDNIEIKQRKPRTKPTMKQEAFAKEYVSNGGNGRQAALKTYDIKSDKPEIVASAIASENLTKPLVVSTIEGYRRETIEKFDELFVIAVAKAKDWIASGEDDQQKFAMNWVENVVKSLSPVQKGNDNRKQSVINHFPSRR